MRALDRCELLLVFREAFPVGELGLARRRSVSRELLLEAFANAPGSMPDGYATRTTPSSTGPPSGGRDRRGVGHARGRRDSAGQDDLVALLAAQQDTDVRRPVGQQQFARRLAQSRHPAFDARLSDC
jgi:hypothetical protein